MKRHGNLFKKIADFGNIYLAYRNARKGKSWQTKIQAFEQNIEGNLRTIQKSLINKTFHTSRYDTEIIHEPKKRLIYKLPFSPDRIVQHALMNVVEPIWEGLFISDSYACRKKKGIHAGSLKTMEFLRKNKYCLKADISKFYPSINHDILFNIVQKKIKCKNTLWLMKDIIYSVDDGYNTPIGNYTSQWFGNLYLNELDQYIKHSLKVKHYLRYCDDFILFSNDKAFLNRVKSQLREFLKNKLDLTFSKCEVFPVGQGIDFLGYRHFKRYILLRKSTAKRVAKRLKVMPRLLKKKRITPEQFRSSIASTEGWLRWANTYNLKIKLRMDKLKELCFA